MRGRGRTGLVPTALLWLLVAAIPAVAAEVPFLSGRIVDDAGVLGTGARARIEAMLQGHDERTTNQIVVLTVPALGDDTVEGYAERVFSTWKLGRKGQDNGVLVIVATGDRRMRIEVGYGLEGTLTDGAAGSIIRNVMAPRFKSGAYDQGIEEGVAAIVGVLEGNAGSATPDAAAGSARGSGSAAKSSGLEGPDLPWYQRILLGAFIFGIIGVFTVIGVMTPGSGWFLYVFLIPFWATFPVVVVGSGGAIGLLATYVVGFPIAKLIIRNKPWYHKAAQDLNRTGRASIGGLTITSIGSSSFSGGGGGDFSGGGGSSGGGGASGSW